MADFVVAAKISEVTPGHMKTVLVNGKQIALANIDGEFFAMGDSCTHAGCSLGGEGVLDGNVVTCGCHGGQFDVTTGKLVRPPPAEDEPSYEVKTEGDTILVRI
ncbi:Rieske 2Fe-2S domain-containing protein [Candidatus Gottesmanbacteria bacterium]|nr:Rieske 2Fe-2S domain-containing protein [Candidatus Gottesmanbacteria bacterium]